MARKMIMIPTSRYFVRKRRRHLLCQCHCRIGSAPPPSSPASNGSANKRPTNVMKSTPRHRPAPAAVDNGGVADFSADKKKMEEWNDDNDTDLQFLVNMGYNWREAKACYLDADLNVERAAAMLSSALEERKRAKKLRG